jgi:hypothetical protein
MIEFRVEITGWREGLRKVSLTTLLHEHAGLSLVEAKACTGRVLDGRLVALSVPSQEAADNLAARLRELGAIAFASPASRNGNGAWELWRQDDNGNRVRVARYGSQDAARAELARFEALGHKQIYWLEDAS